MNYIEQYPPEKTRPLSSPRTPNLIRLLCTVVLATLAGSVGGRATAQDDHAANMQQGMKLFDEVVEAALRESCIDCHGGDDVNGDLDFATRAGLIKGGSLGPAVVPGKRDESLLYKVIMHSAEPAMPPDDDQLEDSVREAIGKWIDLGAPYSRDLVEDAREIEDRSVVTEKDRQFWSFLPLKKQSDIKDASIDLFIERKLSDAHLQLSPQADRRSLIVRASLDLTGLPPTPAEVEAFVNDDSPQAWSKLIDRLLQSPRYGERWARHWLDLARYADSGGFENDNDRPHAWPYRDFVIKSFNQNMPYDKFVRYQLAGDEIAPDSPLAWKATGFLACGVKNGQVTQREGEQERYDVIDDWVNTTGNAFLGLSLGCARCHDHKFDPIPANDYYSLASIFTQSTRRWENVASKPTTKQQAKINKHDAKLESARVDLQRYESKLHEKIDADTDKPDPDLLSSWIYLRPQQYESISTPSPENENPLQRARIVTDEVAPFTYRATFVNGGHAGYNFSYRTTLKNLTGVAIEFLPDMDNPRGGVGTNAAGQFKLKKGKLEATPWRDGKRGKSREIQVTHTNATEHSDWVEGTFVANKKGKKEKKKVPQTMPRFKNAKQPQAIFLGWDRLPEADQWEFKIQISCHNDDPAGRPSVGKVRLKMRAGEKELPLLQPGVEGSLIEKALTAKGISQHAGSDESPSNAAIIEWKKAKDPKWLELAQAVYDMENQLPPIPFTTSLVITEGKTPAHWRTQSIDFWDELYFLRRGSVNNKTEVATAGFLQVASRNGGETFDRWLPENTNDLTSGRRTALANWILDTDDGAGHLAARVMVNRLWHHHFGVGIVATPSDFGVQGSAPTHPELLDYLAATFIESGWDVKAMHRTIMTTKAYRQASAVRQSALNSDPQNSLLWRYSPKRLEAEAIRDRMLFVSELLNPKMFGPGTLDEKMLRRSIYFKVKRSALIPSLVQLNWPDSLISLDKRSVTTVAPQALMLMNNAEVRRYAEAFADRLIKSGGDHVQRAYSIAFGREATPDEHEASTSFLDSQQETFAEDGQRQSLVNFCQAIMSLNEFSYLQ